MAFQAALAYGQQPSEDGRVRYAHRIWVKWCVERTLRLLLLTV